MIPIRKDGRKEATFYQKQNGSGLGLIKGEL
jgi:hypothetical protein